MEGKDLEATWTSWSSDFAGGSFTVKKLLNSILLDLQLFLLSFRRIRI